uniref:TNF receptor superfamily member 13C n=1 Tax=Prolemur simus TaxID=1328070 RepID=A0A8C9DCY8_PROSS
MRRGARRPRGRDGPPPTPCDPAQCFDLLVRHCVACKLLRTAWTGPSRPPPLSPPMSTSPPQESVGAGAGPEAALPLPGLLFGAPALLGLVLALALVGLVSWRRRRLRGTASPEGPDGGQHEPLDNVIILSPGTLDATAPVWPPPREEDPGTTPSGHSVPVPATELGSTELVTTKTAGPEQQ